MEKDAKVDEKALKAALKKGKLSFVSLTTTKPLHAKAAYVIKTPGLT